jgi:uracil-DNA glycosylase
MNTKGRDFATLWQNLEAILTAEPTTNTIFNQYRDSNDQVDVQDAAAIRTKNLRRYVAEATETASILVVGEAAGPWGCRFSGVPFTGEKQLLDPTFPLRGERSSKTILVPCNSYIFG